MTEDTVTRPAEGVDAYLAEFDRVQRARRRSEPEWLANLRKRAIDRFGGLGLPTTALEEWKFTSVAPIAEQTFRLAENGKVVDVDPFAFKQVAAQLVFVNGRFVPSLSTSGVLPDGVEVGGLAAALASTPARLQPYLDRSDRFERESFVALNAAFAGDGAFVSIPARTVLEDPIHLLSVTNAPDGAVACYPRNLVLVGEDSQVRIIESYAGVTGTASLTDAVTDIVVGPNAVVDHYKLQRESANGFHVGRTDIAASRGSAVTTHSLSIGGRLVRNDVVAALDGEGADCTLNGLYVAGADGLVDNHTTIDHLKPHCTSHELYKGILTGRARGVFNGKIVVRPDAQKTDAKQTNKALLLSDAARINTKPQLEIFADDVKCTHGAAVGQLEDDAIFYLRSRGLDLPEARKLLIYAFAGEVLNRIRIEPLREVAERIVLARCIAN